MVRAHLRLRVALYQQQCTVDPLFAFAFIQTFVEILRDYFGALSAATLRDNFDVVYQVGLSSFYSRPNRDPAQLLEETLDSIGYPNTTSPNQLRDIVLPPSLLQKILTVTGVAGLGNSGHGNIAPFSSPIPWRKAGLRYNNNEIYFDVTEELKAVVGPYVHPILPIIPIGVYPYLTVQGRDALLRDLREDRL